MFNGVLPIGSVVTLKGGEKKVMIIGICQFQAVAGEEKPRIWDYVGCPFPEGYLGPDKTYLFNNEQIDKIYAVGYQDEEQFAFKVKADAALQNIRNQEEDNMPNDKE